jgi:hypothetical protein
MDMARIVLLSGYSQMDSCPRKRGQAILVKELLLDMGHAVVHLNWFDEIRRAAMLLGRASHDSNVQGHGDVDGQRAEMLQNAAAIVAFPDLKDSVGGAYVSFLREMFPGKPIIAVSPHEWMALAEKTENVLAEQGASAFVLIDGEFSKNFQEALGTNGVPEERAPDRKLPAPTPRSEEAYRQVLFPVRVRRRKKALLQNDDLGG